MGFLDESYATLLSPLLRVAPKEKGELSGLAKGFEKGREEEGAEDFCDMADVMERGLARELVADFMEPLPDSSNLWKFAVERSADRREYRLYCENGEFLMFAKVARDCRHIDISMYDPRDTESTVPGRHRPAFTLSCNRDKLDWRLVQDRCDHCRYQPASDVHCPFCGGFGSEILRVRHTNAEVGDGINHCMNVRIPAAASSGGHASEHHFITKMPAWNEKVECLVLDFKGRKVLASAKNFQVVSAEDRGERVVCQYGKLGGNSFGLDFRFPLTVIQAFGMSLTTLFWE